MMVRTDAGDLGCVVEACAEGLVDVEIAMGVARFQGDLVVPITAEDGSVTNHVFERVSMGNPHAITFEASEAATFDRVAPIVEKTPSGGTNVELVHIEGEVLVVRVWERGVGYTLACGTGACAVVAAACRRGLTPFGRDTTVRLPGGNLSIRVSEPTLEVTLRGPARRVFQGELSLF
jgi:diaminopimelate epimerase